MAFAAETTSFSGYSPTSTPVLDIVRPAPSRRAGKLTSGEYFFLSGVLISSLIGLPSFRSALAESGAAAGHWKLALSPALALLAALLIHECGHLLGGLAAGFRFSGAGAMSGEIQQGLFGPKLLRLAYVHGPKSDHMRGRLIAMFAGGPLAGLFFGLALELSRDWTQAGPLTQFRVHLISVFNVLISLAALLPDVSRSGYFSDGARLLALLKNDGQTARLLAI